MVATLHLGEIMPITRRSILPVVGVAAVASGAGYAGWRFLGRPAPAVAQSTPVPPPIPGATPSGPQYTARTLGSDSAPVKVHEYFSLTCTHCAHFGTVTMPQVKPNLVDTAKVQFVYHEFFLDQVGLKAAQGAG